MLRCIYMQGGELRHMALEPVCAVGFLSLLWLPLHSMASFTFAVFSLLVKT